MTKNKYIDAALELINQNKQSYTERTSTLDDIKELDEATFEVEEPEGKIKIPSGLLRQVVNKLKGQLQRPSVSLRAPDAKGEISDLVRDALNYTLEEGGLDEALFGKPSAIMHMFQYGDGWIMPYIDEDKKIPLRWRTLNPMNVFVDPNANNMSEVKLFVYILPMNKKYADSFFGKDVGTGKIPRSDDYGRDFMKNQNQDTQANKDMVEVMYAYDITDKENPVYTVATGSDLRIQEQQKGKKYPFYMKSMSAKKESAFIPAINLMCFQSNEGFFNFGIGHIFYKYAKVREELLNKLIQQGLNNMNDLSVLNVDRGQEGVFLKKIKDARLLQEKGKHPVIVNDSGQAVQVTPLQAAEFNNSLEQLNSDLDQEIKRWDINLEAIREGTSATATQITLEAEAQTKFIQDILSTNNHTWIWVYYVAISMLGKYISKKDKTPIPTNVRYTEIEQSPITGEAVTKEDEFGREIKGEKEFATLGEVADYCRRFTFFAEANTKSGVIENDSLKIAKLTQFASIAGGMPGVMLEVGKKFARGLNLDMGDDVFQNPNMEKKPSPADMMAAEQEGQAPQEGQVPQQGAIPQLPI